MKIKWLSEFDGQVGLAVEPDDYDGTPQISHLWMDRGPKSRHWDREAVATGLVFGRYFGGEITMPHKFSPAVATGLRRMAGPVPINVGPIEYYPKGLPEGERRLHLLVDEPVPEDLMEPKDQSACYLQILRSDRASGSIRRVNGLSVASNAWLHSEPRAVSGLLPFIALACLFAEDLEAGTIVLPPSSAGVPDEWQEVRQILATARLGLEVA